MTWKDEADGFFSVAVGVLLIALITATLAHGQTKSQKEMVARMNEARAAQSVIDGLERPPLVWNSELASCASRFARECAKSGWEHNAIPMDYVRANCDYFSPDADAPNGYWGQAGECLAWQKRVDPVTLWLMSDGHRATIMWRLFTDIGIGESGGRQGGYVLFVACRWPRDEAATSGVRQKSCAGGT